MPSYQRTFPGLPEEIRRARNWVKSILSGTPYVDDAALIVTELGANALLHTASGRGVGRFDVSLTPSGKGVEISVTDGGGSRTGPHVEHPPEDATHGRGLSMVTVLAEHVDIRGDDHGRTVTAYLTRAPIRYPRPPILDEQPLHEGPPVLYRD